MPPHHPWSSLNAIRCVVAHFSDLPGVQRDCKRPPSPASARVDWSRACPDVVSVRAALTLVLIGQLLATDSPGGQYLPAMCGDRRSRERHVTTYSYYYGTWPTELARPRLAIGASAMTLAHADLTLSLV